nr:MAG TPA: hypothetical protein [Caudoviricetes sp.]
MTTRFSVLFFLSISFLVFSRPTVLHSYKIRLN